MQITIRDLSEPKVGQSEHYAHALRVLEMLRGREGTVDATVYERLEATLVSMVGACFTYARPFTLTSIVGGACALAVAA